MTPALRAILEAIPTVGETATRRALGKFLVALPDGECIARVTSEPAADGSGCSLHFAVRRNCIRLAGDLLEHGASSSEVDAAGNQPLHLAAQQASYDLCQLLIDFGADMEARTKSGETALALAARLGHTLTARVLIEGGADVNCSDRDGWTPLHYAAFGGYSDLCDLLLNRNADAKTLTKEGEGEAPDCAASLARLRNYQDLADTLELAMDAQTPPPGLDSTAAADFDELLRSNPADQRFLEALKIQHGLYGGPALLD